MEHRVIRLKRLLERAKDDPAYFCEVILGLQLTTHQRDICRQVASKDVTVVQSANGVGKSWLAAVLVLWFLFTRQDSIVLTTAPTAVQLRNVLWGYIRSHYTTSRIDLGGRLLQSPIPKLELDDRHYAVGISTTKVERLSGYHAEHIMVVVDEASGVDAEIFSALLSVNPSKSFYIGNPIRTDGHFYSLCCKAQDPANHWGFAKISSHDSPHIHLDRSPVGLADQGFLRKVAAQYGENSPWWIAHVLGEFPDSIEDLLVPRAWLVSAVEEHKRRGVVTKGPARIGIDYSEGVGRDHSVVVVRDEDQLLEIVHSNTWSPDVLAAQVQSLASKYQVEPRNIAWDATGTGSDFSNRLRQVGLSGCRAFKGACSAAPEAVGANLRACSYWQLRRRLDPEAVLSTGKQQPPFAISPKHYEMLRREFEVLTYELDARGKTRICPKDQIKEKLGGNSPDFTDALSMSFCWG